MVNFATVTVRPASGAALRFQNWTLVGTANQGIAVNDNSDATYLSQGSGENIADYTVADPAVTGGAKIYAVRSWVKVAETTGNPFVSVPQNWLGIGQRSDQGGVIYAQWDYVNAHPAAPGTTYSFGWRTSRPDGGEWTIADVNNIILVLRVFQQSPALAWRVVEAGFDIAYNARPIVIAATPAELSTVTTTTRPTVTWTWSDAENDRQESFRVKIFTQAVAEAVGFNADTSPAVYDSGKVYSDATSHTITTDLANGTYYFYVNGWQAWPVSAHDSGWDSNKFTVAVDPPAVPHVTAVAAEPTSTLGPRVLVSLAGHDNLLTEEQASFETGTTGWSAGANTETPLGRAFPVPTLHGSWALQIRSLAAGNISAFTNPRSSISPSTTYTAMAWFLSPVARTAFVQIDWYDGSGVFISSSAGTSITTSTSVWLPSMVSATSPSNAATAAIVLWVQGTTGALESHWIDQVALVPGVPLGGNLLPANQSSIETDDTNWSAGSNTAKVRTTVQAYLAAAALQLSNSSGGASDISVFANPRAPVTGYRMYQLSAWFRSAVTPRQARVEITWTTALSGGSTISTSTGTAVTTTVGGWTQATVLAAAPSNALGAAMTLRVIGTAAGEVHYVDSVAIQPVVWVRGGLAAAGVTYVLEYSDDNGVTWTLHPRGGAAPGSTLTQLASLYDYEIPAGVARMYRARARATVSGLTLTSDPSVQPLGAAAMSFAAWWLKDPSDPTRNARLRLTETSFTSDAEEPQGVDWPLSRATPVVVSDTPRSEMFELGLSFLDDTDYSRFETLRTSQRTLLLQSDWGRQWWVRLGGTRKATVLRAVAPRSTLARTVTVPAVEVDVLA